MRVLTITINERCPLACSHCSLGMSAGFRGHDRVINRETLCDVIKSVDAEVYDLILFAGGEPSLERELLQVGVANCQERGIDSAIVTAPIWAGNPRSAITFVRAVSQVSVLVLSFDTYHLDYLKLQHYRHAIDSARVHGVQCTLHIVYANDAEYNTVQEYYQQLGRDVHLNFARTIDVGNAVAMDELERVPLRKDAIDAIKMLPRTCQVGNALIDTQLSVHACCWAASIESSPLSWRADQDRQAELRQLEADPTFRRMLNTGFIDALSDEAVADLSRRLENRAFASECDLCIAAMNPCLRDWWSQHVAYPSPSAPLTRSSILPDIQT